MPENGGHIAEMGLQGAVHPFKGTVPCQQRLGTEGFFGGAACQQNPDGDVVLFTQLLEGHGSARRGGGDPVVTAGMAQTVAIFTVTGQGIVLGLQLGQLVTLLVGCIGIFHRGLKLGNAGRGLLDLVAAGSVLLLDVIPKLLHTEHITVVGNSNSALAVGNGLIDELCDARLAIQQRILCVNVKMNEILHIIVCCQIL